MTLKVTPKGDRDAKQLTTVHDHKICHHHFQNLYAEE